MDKYLKLLEKDYSNEELIENLKKEENDDFEKIFSIISLKTPIKENFFKILIQKLVDNPTPLREITALKLEEINKLNPEFFNYKEAQEIISRGIIDINPNISRAICNIIQENEYLKNSLEEKIIEKIEEILKEENNFKDKKSEFQNNNKSHAKNKKLFSLYWLLEALSITNTQKNNDKILNLVTITINFSDYTIREKSAKIIKNIKNCPKDLIKKAIEDENFYVKNQVYDKIDNEID